MLCLSAATPVTAQNAQSDKYMVVLDASGSMWGKVEGRAKFEIVRQSFAKLLKGWQGKNVDAGLIVYGHRRKGDCSDIEVVSAPAPLAGSKLSEKVAQISPKGKTPLGESVRLAAQQLKFTEQKATVIVLTDGIETCGVDTCQLGRELEKLGVDFTAHVVGFDIKKKQDRAQLACLAQTTGGTFVTADNASQLDAALRKTATAGTVPRLEAVLADTGEPASKVHWQITGGGQNFAQASDYSVLELKTKNAKPFAAGPYKVVATSGDFSGSASFSLPLRAPKFIVKLQRKAPETVLTVTGAVTAGSKFTVQWIGGGKADDRIAIVPKGKGFAADTLASVSVSNGNPVTLVAPANPGDYDLVYVYDAYGHKRIDARIRLKVAKGGFALTPIGPIKSSAPFKVKWTGPGLAPDMIAIGPRTKGTDDYSSLQWVSKGNPLQLNAPTTPGDYELRYYGDGYKLLFSTPVTVE